MSYMFKGAAAFNQDINTKEITAENSPTGVAYIAWNIGNATNLDFIFNMSGLKYNKPKWYQEIKGYFKYKAVN